MALNDLKKGFCVKVTGDPWTQSFTKQTEWFEGYRYV